MEFKDVLANNEAMEGKWQTGSPPPPGDFRTVMEAIQKVLPPQVEETLANNTYSRVFWGLSQVYYKQWLNQTFKSAAGMFIAVNSSPLRITSAKVYEQGGWIELVSAEWQGFGFGSSTGFEVSDGFLSESDSVSLKAMAGVTGQDSLMQKITQAIAPFDKLPRYSKYGVLLLLIDMLWWGWACFKNNGDTIGEGDQEFFAYCSESALETYQYFLKHPEEKPSLRMKLRFEFYLTTVGLDLSKLPPDNSGENPDDDTSDFPILIDLEFIGYPKDMVGLGEYGPNRQNDVFLLATVNARTNEKIRYTLTNAGLDSDEIVEDRIWATTANREKDSPLGITTVVRNPDGAYIPGKLINSKDNAIALSLQPGDVFGLVLDVGSLTPKEGSPYTRPTTFNCYFEFDDLPENTFIESQVIIPLA
jgi:hypothetical protein